MKTHSVDVVIVGSGAGASPIAAELSRIGAQVLVLEKGPYYTVRDFTHDEVAICLRDFWQPWPSQEPRVLVRDNTPPRLGREGWTASCVGGGTVHMSGFTYRLHENDFQLATKLGGLSGTDLADWPISLEELSPYYDKVEARIGVSGESGTNPWETRSRPYPLPPLPAHPASKLVEQAARSQGFHPFPTPRAIVSRPYAGRPACSLLGLCGDWGCETGAKSSMLATLIPEAEATGRCEIRPRSMVCRILTRQGKASGVEYIDSQGALHRVNARVVVVAATAIESARLLLLSQIANGSGLVGKNLTFSNFGKATAVFNRHELLARLGPKNFQLPFLQCSIQDDYWMEKSSLACPKGGTYNFLLAYPNVINAGIRLFLDSGKKLWGAPLKERIRQYFHDEVWIEFEIFGEFLPWKECYVDLDPQVKDRWQLPVARIHVKHHPKDVLTNTNMVKRGMDILKAMQPAPQRVYPWTWGSTTFHLQHGTCRFGNNPSLSVLDRNCQSHEVENLYVTDGSFMPTSGGVPATPTILANSFRVADHLCERFKRREI